MFSIGRAASRLLVVSLFAAILVPPSLFVPAGASVAAAAQLRPSGQDPVPPATPGTYRSASSAANNPITGITIPKPAGTTTNDVLLAAITIRGDVVSITPPSGWTQVRTDANGTVLTQTIFRKVAGASEPASYAWTFGDAVPAAVGGIVAYSGVSTTTPVDVSGGQANAASTTVTAPSVTTTVANTRVVGFFGTTNDTTFTPPSGMTERYDTDADGSTQVAAEAADVAQAAAGATGTKAATAATSNANIGQLVALRPSGTIALRAASSAETVPTTSLAIPTPAGVVADDVLVASIATRADDVATPPAGWTLVRSDASATVLRQSVYVRTAVSGEPASHTWTFAGPVATAVGGILAFSGIDPVDPVDLAGGQVNASATSATAPSITTTVADSTLVALYSIANDATFTPPSGMTERFDQLANTFSDGAATAADVSVAAAGATGTKVATASKAGVNIGILVALRPATATANLGMAPQHTFETWDLGAGDGLAVNVATRNTLITHPLVSLPIRGAAVHVGLTWNAKDRTDLGMGPGWRLDVFRRLRINGNGSITFSDGSGTRHAFTNPVTVGAITTYSRPASLYATLTKDTTPNPDRFTLVYRDLSSDTFEVNGSDGLLVREADRFGNGVDLGYNAGTTNLATITDTVPSPDRVIDVTWDTAPTPDRLTKITDWAYISAGVVQTSATGSRREHRFSYDGSGNLAGWTDPLQTTNSCPTAASHRTCLTYSAGLVTGISKTQTVTTTGGGTLGTSTRTITTEIAYAGSDASTVTDAHQQAQASPARTTFTAESSTVLRVDRPTTTTRYGQVAAADAYGRIASVWRVLDGSTTFETRTTWDATYPIEPATVTENYGALGGAPARTTSYTYQASSLGLVSRIVEPLTATDDRWTDLVYNTNNDVVSETVSAEGSATDRTVTKSCYTTQSNSCSDASPGLTMVRRIDRWVSGGASDEDTNVVTDFAYDAYGQRTSTTRANRNGAGTLLDARVDTAAYDDKGDLTTEIVNRVDGVVSPASYDTEPDPATGARTDLTTLHAYDTAGNRVSSADPRRAIALAATTYARDAFGRSVTDGWGTADTGGSWSSTTADHDVTGSVGTITLGSITNRNAYLTSVSAADAEVLVKVRVDTLAAGADHLFWVYLRRQDSSNYYQARLSFDIDHTVKAYFSRTAAGTTTVIDAGTSSVGHTTSDWYWMRARVSGTTSVTGKIRVWRDGSAEPAGWLVDGTDASAPAALQGSGHTGIRFQLGSGYSGGFPVTASVDDFALTSIGGGGQTVAADDFVSRTTYDPLDQAVSASTPTTTGIAGSATTSTTAYDELGGIRLATDEAARVTATVFDRAGRASATWDDPAPSGGASQSSAMTYDADGRLLTIMDQRQVAAPSFNLGWTANAYDGLGRLTSSTEAQSSSPDVATETRTTYDGLDRAITNEVGYGSPASQKTDTAFDLGGRATSVDDGFTCAVSTFDYRDLVLTRQDSLDSATCAANTGSRTVTSTYDALGRLTQAEITAGPSTGDRPTIASYDAAGNVLTSAVRTGGTTSLTTLTANRLDQVLTHARPDGSTAKTTYDPVGNPLDACTWASGTAGACLAVGSDGWTNPPTNSTSTRWDARNGRIALTDSASNRTTVYDPSHGYAVSAVYLPTVADQTREHQALYTYDSEHRLTGITQRLCTISSGHACTSTTATGSDTYAYDDADSRTQVVEDNGATSTDDRYCHDALGQLTARRTAAACTTSPDETNTFDDAGNRTQAVAGGTTTNFAYTAAGILCDLETGAAANCTGGNVGSDDAGRLASYAGYTYLYDAEGRLVAACNDADCVGTGFRRIDFVYDGAGHRTKITETPAVGSAVVTTFRYAGDAIVAESKDGVLTREYTVDEGGTISKVTIPAGQTAAGTYLVTWNGHGDALALYRIESSGLLTLANSYTYSTWGLPTTATHNSIPDLGFRFLYVGAADVQWDGTYGLPLLYMHARHYSPILGRFLQPDPSRLDAKLFVYTGNGPVSRIDPAGTCWGCRFLVLQQALRYALPLLKSYSAVTVRMSGHKYVVYKVPRSLRGSRSVINYNVDRAGCDRGTWGMALVGIFVSGAGFVASTVSLLAAPPTGLTSLTVTAIGWDLSLSGLALSTAQVIDCASR